MTLRPGFIKLFAPPLGDSIPHLCRLPIAHLVAKTIPLPFPCPLTCSRSVSATKSAIGTKQDAQEDQPPRIQHPTCMIEGRKTNKPTILPLHWMGGEAKKKKKKRNYLFSDIFPLVAARSDCCACDLTARGRSLRSRNLSISGAGKGSKDYVL